MVIDMGGGTVDMTLHKSEASLGGGDLMLAEVTHRECLPEVSWQCLSEVSNNGFMTVIFAICGPQTQPL
jgi:hypothetical protein